MFPDKAYVNLEVPDQRQFALVDENPVPGKFILTGNQQFNIRETLSQTLAGRTGILTLLPFDWEEIKAYQDMSDIDELILNGFYPRLHHMV